MMGVAMASDSDFIDVDEAAMLEDSSEGLIMEDIVLAEGADDHSDGITSGSRDSMLRLLALAPDSQLDRSVVAGLLALVGRPAGDVRRGLCSILKRLGASSTLATQIIEAMWQRLGGEASDLDEWGGDTIDSTGED